MGPRLPCVSFPKDDPNHYALDRLFIIARFCAPPFPDALVETSRQRPSPAPAIGGPGLAPIVGRARESRPAVPPPTSVPRLAPLCSTEHDARAASSPPPAQ